MQSITKETINTAYDYPEYKKLIEELLAKNSTTGANQSNSYIEYTRLNLQRMKRIEKTFKLNPVLKKELDNLNQNLVWVAITEAWCGDAANIVPVIAKVSEHSERINCKLILRDENPDIMDKYLTNGTRSIPKLICLSGETLSEKGIWGPRPKELQNRVNRIKLNPDFKKDDLVKEIQMWYFKNNTEDIQRELAEKIKEWNKI